MDPSNTPQYTPQQGQPDYPSAAQGPIASTAPYSPYEIDQTQPPIMNSPPYTSVNQAAPSPYPMPSGAYNPNIPQQPPAQYGANVTPPINAPHLKSNPNSTQNSLQIAEIRDGIVIMNDGSFRSVIMVKSINFDLMSSQEQEAVEFSYQGFLNSLYFPIQIFIRSQKVDLRPYIDRLDKIRSEHDNMLLALLMEDYVGFIADLSQQTNIMDKKFYVIIPYFPVADLTKALTQSKNFFGGLKGLFNNKEQHVTVNEADLNKAKDELRNRVQAALAGLMQCSIQGLPLDTQELIELYYDTYNPDTATRQQLKNFGDLSAPVVEKGQGMAPQPNLDREVL